MDSFTCRWCNTPKTLECYKSGIRTKRGHDTVCLDCRRARISQLRKENPEKYRAKDAKIRQTPAYQAYHKTYYQENAEKLREAGRNRYNANPEPSKQRSKIQRERLGQAYKDYLKEYQRKNRATLNKKQAERNRDLNRRIKMLVCGAINKHLRGNIKKSRTLVYLGCDISFFKAYIAARFRDGMSWDNHGKIWHLDHKIPCSAFDLSKEINIHACFHHTNYQPLLIAENLDKRDTLPDGRRARDLTAKIDLTRPDTVCVSGLFDCRG